MELTRVALRRKRFVISRSTVSCSTARTSCPSRWISVIGYVFFVYTVPCPAQLNPFVKRLKEQFHAPWSKALGKLPQLANSIPFEWVSAPPPPKDLTCGQHQNQGHLFFVWHRGRAPHRAPLFAAWERWSHLYLQRDLLRSRYRSTHVGGATV